MTVMPLTGFWVCIFLLIIDESTESFMGSQKDFYNHSVCLYYMGFYSEKEEKEKRN